jgi:ankyrin repeat protein
MGEQLSGWRVKMATWTVVHALLQHNKVDVNLRHSDGVTALYMASQQGHVEVVRALLEHDKVDVNLTVEY